MSSSTMIELDRRRCLRAFRSILKTCEKRDISPPEAYFACKLACAILEKEYGITFAEDSKRFLDSLLHYKEGSPEQ